MAHPSERTRTKSGEYLARAAEAGASQELRLDDPRVQVYLARLKFPGDAAAMEKWLANDKIKERGIEKEIENSGLSRRYRAYIEDRACVPADATIDVKDEAALRELLGGVQAHEPERTVH